MSQKFSTFSITSSLINKQKLLFYPFGYGRLYDKYNFNKYPNFIYFCEYKKEWEYFPKNIIENKKIHMITYGDDFFDNAKKTLIKEAIDSKFFYSIKAYSGKDLDDDFKIKYKHVLEKKRGGGYFIWRGYVIQQKLKELNNGDFLIFNDAGNTINKKGDKRLLEYINMLDKSNYGLLWFRTVYKEKRWTFKQTFDYFSIPLESNIGNSGQHWVGGLIFQKNSHSMKLLNLYLKTLNDNSLLFTDYYHDKQSHDFVENRHDQSVLSIISKIHGCISIPPSNGAAFECATPFHFSWPILCTHRRNGVDNHSYSKNYDGGKLHSK
tara:strand:- start:615 stop:1580 length:966 start_codon:yes stop_codon:yes gene_type:complete